MAIKQSIKPSLTGGTTAPHGYRWGVQALTPEHIGLLAALSHHWNKPINQILSYALDDYAFSCSKQVDEAYESFAHRFTKDNC